MKTESFITIDLTEFGYRELRMAARLLTALCDQGMPDDFDDVGLTIMMNLHSGTVFLTNDNCEVAMMNGDKLESFYSCPECGHEGFKDKMTHGEDNEKCKRYVAAIGE